MQLPGRPPAARSPRPRRVAPATASLLRPTSTGKPNAWSCSTSRWVIPTPRQLVPSGVFVHLHESACRRCGSSTASEFCTTPRMGIRIWLCPTGQGQRPCIHMPTEATACIYTPRVSTRPESTRRGSRSAKRACPVPGTSTRYQCLSVSAYIDTQRASTRRSEPVGASTRRVHPHAAVLDPPTSFAPLERRGSTRKFKRNGKHRQNRRRRTPLHVPGGIRVIYRRNRICPSPSQN